MPGAVKMSGEAYGILTIGADEILELLKSKALGKGGATDRMLGDIHERVSQLQALGFTEIEEWTGGRRGDPEVEKQRYNLKSFTTPILDSCRDLMRNRGFSTEADIERKTEKISMMVERLCLLNHITLRK